MTETLTPVMQLARPPLEWIDVLEALKIGCGPINTLEQVFADPHVAGARHGGGDARTPSGETVKVIANPVKLSATPPDYRSPPPVLGQHTEEVLGGVLGHGGGGDRGAAGKGIL